MSPRGIARFKRLKEVSMTDKDRLKYAFEQTPSVFNLLTTIRSRRVGRGYRIDSGTEY